MSYTPPFTLTPIILEYVEDIAKELGCLEGAKLISPSLMLRRANRIKTIHASLAIEGNTLSFEQVTDIIEGKIVVGPEKDILEVKNLWCIYRKIKDFNPLKCDDFLKAHNLLMNGLVTETGQFRKKNVGMFEERNLVHAAPPAQRIHMFIGNLFDFLSNNDQLSLIIKSCIFSYEIEFIYPFMGGNSLMGRFWQKVILIKAHPIFEFIPLEEMIKENQSAYYDAFSQSDRLGESTLFVAFCLDMISKALLKYSQSNHI